MKNATENGMVFELCYGPAIVDPSKRRALIQAAVDLRSACLGIRNPRPRIILSSSNRKVGGGGGGANFGVIALRYPHDLMNVLKCVLGFGDDVVSMVLGHNAALAVQQGRKSRQLYGVIVHKSFPGGFIPRHEFY